MSTSGNHVALQGAKNRKRRSWPANSLRASKQQKCLSLTPPSQVLPVPVQHSPAAILPSASECEVEQQECSPLMLHQVVSALAVEGSPIDNASETNKLADESCLECSQVDTYPRGNTCEARKVMDPPRPGGSHADICPSVNHCETKKVIGGIRVGGSHADIVPSDNTCEFQMETDGTGVERCQTDVAPSDNICEVREAANEPGVEGCQVDMVPSDNTCEAKKVTDKTQMEGSQADVAASDAICEGRKVTDETRQLTAFLQQVESTADFYEMCSTVQKDLELLLEEPVVPFGSFVQGLCVGGSDLDVKVTVRLESVLDAVEACKPKAPKIYYDTDSDSDVSPVRATSKVQAVVPQGLKSVSGMIQDSDSDDELPVSLPRTSPKQKPQGSFELMEKILHARVPLLRYRHQPTKLLVDISSACTELDADILIKREIEILKCRDIVLLVKVWSNRRAINGAYSGHLSSYCWVLLVLYAFRHRATLQSAPSEALELNAALSLFFETVVSLGASSIGDCALDPLFGTLVKRPREYSRYSAPLFIQDISDPRQNAARCLKQGSWRSCIAEARRALALCSSGGKRFARNLFEEKISCT